MLTLVYGCGLRCGELINLNIEDVNGQRKVVHIKNGKGGKDRIIPIPVQLLIELRNYYITYKPKKYLFEGQCKLGYTIVGGQLI